MGLLIGGGSSNAQKFWSKVVSSVDEDRQAIGGGGPAAWVEEVKFM
jgi:hypothetical protein